MVGLRDEQNAAFASVVSLKLIPSTALFYYFDNNMRSVVAGIVGRSAGSRLSLR